MTRSLKKYAQLNWAWIYHVHVEMPTIVEYKFHAHVELSMKNVISESENKLSRIHHKQSYLPNGTMRGQDIL